ncbi:hypothetical protein Zmor_026861 [Zophobas morio]|uniref:Uncharacterized protein n=1 Tax=Zophobas morio TaxID=2755281 RepID=A0AA38HVK1_9CUCU|nr:hypothetical protein Zmor_026861 [Zophobas morio]
MKLLEKGPKHEIKTDQIRELEILAIDTDLAIDKLKNKEGARQARLECIQTIKRQVNHNRWRKRTENNDGRTLKDIKEKMQERDLFIGRQRQQNCHHEQRRLCKQSRRFF